MTPNAIYQRCFYHEFREAASRCPICSRYFCRECVTEHDNRVLCVECLKAIVAGRAVRRSGMRRVLRGLLPVAGGLFSLACFYLSSRTVFLVSSVVSSRTVWWAEE